ncbi:MAG: hypothetical protein ACK5II_06190 [Paracoccus sp. (in: a-proteobacteria)]
MPISAYADRPTGGDGPAGAGHSGGSLDGGPGSGRNNNRSDRRRSQQDTDNPASQDRGSRNRTNRDNASRGEHAPGGHKAGSEDQTSGNSGITASAQHGSDGQVSVSSGGDDRSRDMRSEQDKALDAVRSNQAVPLANVLEQIRQTTKSQIIDVRLVQNNHDQLLYMVTLMRSSGDIEERTFMARTGHPVRRP